MLILRPHPQIKMSQEVIQGQESALQLVYLGAFLPSPIWALPAKGLKVLVISLACLPPRGCFLLGLCYFLPCFFC